MPQQHRPKTSQKRAAPVVEEEGYVIRPNFQKKFRPLIVKQCIHDALMEELSDRDYDAKTAGELSKTVAENVKAKLKLLDLERYKFIVHVVIGEQRGEGAKMVNRCLWDSDTDNYAHDIFINVSDGKITPLPRLLVPGY